MVQFKVVKNANVNGTSLIGEYCASYTALRAVLGVPETSTNRNCGDGKVSTEWYLKDNLGNVYTIYDWKETNLYSEDLPSVRKFRQRPVYDWHIGGRNRDHLSALTMWLRDKIIEWTREEAQKAQDVQNKMYEDKYAAMGVQFVPLEKIVEKKSVSLSSCTSATARCLG
jgi:hypothetical protein